MSLAIVVETAWIVENLQSVGGGGLFNLAFNLSQVSAAVHEALGQPNMLKHAPVCIYKLTEAQRAVLVADGYLAEIVLVNSTLRLHIRLIHVCPFVARKTIVWPDVNLRVAII
ncbi:MAG TPA: hypothetical protein GXZ82_09930 [Firmicutes bacterium]|jgi:hypothetical protein|nr:hypothetical protein [Bacillota bacterium]